MKNSKFYYQFLVLGILFYLTLQSCGTSTENDKSKSKNYTEDIVGLYSTGGITQNFYRDGSVKISSPVGNSEYKWQILDSNENYIKICEIQQEYKVNFICYTNSSKYPIKVKNCLQDKGSSSLKNFTGKILISEEWLENSDCEGLYFGE